MSAPDVPLPVEGGRAEALPIAETFVSVQGEGKLAGVPSWFVRLSGCNLRCAWCDTPYASWTPEKMTRSLDDLIAEARRASVRHAVVTGGEPLLFPRCAELCARLRSEAGMHVTVETAGTIDLDAPIDLLSASPKLSTSAPDAVAFPREHAMHEARRTNIPALRALLERQRARGAGGIGGIGGIGGAGGADLQLKFVACAQDDLEEIEAILDALGDAAPGPSDVLLMPEGRTPQELAARAPWVVNECLSRGWRYCPRLHIDLFGNRRGT